MALFLALLGLCAGCGGLTLSKSVSPASFFLPGLLQADPPPADPAKEVPVEEPAALVAQAK
jgi:hypothetical protein